MQIAIKGQRLNAGSKQAGIAVPFVATYHPKLKKKNTYYIRMNLLSEYLFLRQWFPKAAQEN